MAQCTAKSKQSGERCRRKAMVGTTVCYMHGGPGALKSRGSRSRHFKDGRLSVHYPKDLQRHVAEALSDPELLSTRESIAMIDAQIIKTTERITGDASAANWREAQKMFTRFRVANRAGDKKRVALALAELEEAIGRGAGDVAASAELRELLKDRATLANHERKRLVDMQQMITAEEALGMIGIIGQSIAEHVSNPDEIRKIRADLERLMGSAVARSNSKAVA